MNKFLETYSPPKLNQEELDTLNRLITRSVTQPIIKKNNSLQTKVQDQWLYWRILPNIQRTYTNPSQTTPED